MWCLPAENSTVSTIVCHVTMYVCQCMHSTGCLLLNKRSNPANKRSNPARWRRGVAWRSGPVAAAAKATAVTSRVERNPSSCTAAGPRWRWLAATQSNYPRRREHERPPPLRSKRYREPLPGTASR